MRDIDNMIYIPRTDTEQHTTPGTAWLKLLCLPFIVIIAFAMFATALVVAFIGLVLPDTTPARELHNLNTIYRDTYNGIRAILNSEI